MFNVRGPQSPSGNERVNPSPYDFLSSYLSWALAIHRRNSRRMQNTEISYMDNLYLTTLTTSQHSSRLFEKLWEKMLLSRILSEKHSDIFEKKFTGLLRCVTGLNPQALEAAQVWAVSPFPLCFSSSLYGAPLNVTDPPIPDSACHSALQRSVQRLDVPFCL